MSGADEKVGGGEDAGLTGAQSVAAEVWALAALALGCNELAKKAETLGQRAYARLMRDDAQRRLIEDGHALLNIADTKEILVLREQPHIAFRERDIEMMRACVAEWDARNPKPVGAPDYMTPEQTGGAP